MERYRRTGFTLIELLIFTAIFALIIGAFITIFVAIVTTQLQQSDASEVGQQGQFLEQQIQYYVSSARLVDMPLDTAQGTLTLQESVSSTDPTMIILSPPSGTQPQFVQSSTASSSSGATSISVTFPNGVTPNDIIAFGVQWTSASITITSVTSTCVTGNLVIANAISNYGITSDAQGYGVISRAGPCTVTANLSSSPGSTETDIVIHEISGVSTSTPLDGSDIAQYPGMNGGELMTSPPVTTFVGGDYIWGIGFDANESGPLTWTPGVDFTARVNSQEIITEDMILPLSGQATATVIPNDPTYADMGIMAFRPATLGLYIQKGSGGALQTLTSNKVKVTNISFTRHYNLNATSSPYGTDSVSYSFTMTSANGQYSQTFQSSAAASIPVPKIALIQQMSGSVAGTGITNVSASYPGNNKKGNLLVAVVSNTGNSSAVVSLSDTAGNIWKEAASSTYGAYNQETSIFYTPNAWNSSNTVSAAFNTGVASPSLFIYEYRGASGATALVQQNGKFFNQYGNGDIFSLTLGDNVTAGNILAFDMQWQTTSTLTAVTSTCTNGGNLIIADTNYLSPWSFSAQGYGVISSSGSCTVSADFTPNNYNFGELAIQEISGVDTSNPLDGHALTFDGYTNISNSGNVTTTQSGDYILGAGFFNSGTNGTGTPGAGFTITNPNPENIQLEETTQLSAGAISAILTYPSSTYLLGGIMAFRSLYSGGTVPFDATASQAQSSTTALSSGFANPSSTVELLIGISYINPSTGSMTPGPGFTVETSSSISGTYVEDKNIYVSGPVSADWAYSESLPPTTTSSSAMIVTFY